MDLIGRKVLRDGGKTLETLVAHMRGVAGDAEFAAPVDAAFERLEESTRSVVRRSQEDAELPGAVATDYLDLVGHTVYGWLWSRMAAAAEPDSAKKATARFYFDRLLPRTLSLAASIEAASACVADFPEDAF